jgi:hypothetical protein
LSVLSYLVNKNKTESSEYKLSVSLCKLETLEGLKCFQILEICEYIRKVNHLTEDKQQLADPFTVVPRKCFVCCLVCVLFSHSLGMNEACIEKD